MSQRNFLEAINERYGAEDDSNAYSEDAFDVGATRSAKKNNKKWEMVGMDAARQKQSNHARLSVLGLQDCNISYAEKTSGQIMAAGLKRVRELNLSDNQHLTAFDIDTIISALPSLVELQLSGTGVGNVSLWSPQSQEININQNVAASGAETSSKSGFALAAASTNSVDDDASSSPSFPIHNNNGNSSSSSSSAAAIVVNSPLTASSNTLRPQSPFRHNNWARLTTLALNRCGITWNNLLEAFPCNLVALVSLHLESNAIDSIHSPSIRRSPSQLHEAMIAKEGTAVTGAIASEEVNNNNKISSQGSFLPMFPALKELNLSFNSIATLDQDSEMIKFFELDTPQLSSLNLTGNKISILPSSTHQKGATPSYLTKLEVLYLTQNEPLVAGANKSNGGHDDDDAVDVVSNVNDEEPLLILDWIRLYCSKVKSLRVSYSDLFGEPNYQTTSTNSNSNSSESNNNIPSTIPRPKSLLSEVQQRSLVIAALPQIETLNSGPVRAKERMDAEMLYLQVARAKKEQVEKQQKDQVTTPTTTATSNGANRFFPWKNFPLIDVLAEKHKNVVLTSLNGDGSGKDKNTNALAAGNALTYTLKLTLRVLSETTKLHDGTTSGSAAVMIQEKISGQKVTTTSTVAVAEDVTRTVPGNMTVGKLRSFVASIFPSIASISKQKKLQAYPNDSGVIPPTVLGAEDDENALILCGVPSNAIVEVFV